MGGKFYELVSQNTCKEANVLQIIIPSAKNANKDSFSMEQFPPVIYPVNDEIVFDHLLEQYQGMADEITVICFEKQSTVHKRLQTYGDPRIQIIDLPELKDLGYTIYQGLKDTHTPVIINFGDTIVFDNLFEKAQDSFFYSEEPLSDVWTFFCIDHGKITNIYDKAHIQSANPQLGQLFVGVFQIMDSADFKSCLEVAMQQKSLEISTFYYALQLYSEIHPFVPVKTSNWFDIGHIDNYYNSKIEVAAREFNHLTIDRNRGLIYKTSEEKEKFIGEIKWYLKLPTDIEYVRPRIFNYSTSYEHPFVCMEYYAYHTIHELFLYGKLNYKQWQDIFSRIRFIYNDFRRYRVSDARIQSSLKDMYLTKTMQRLRKLRENPNFKPFFTNEITLNGEIYPSLDRIMSILEKQIPKELFDIVEFSIIHGDLCFANIMIDPNLAFLKVIDPRGKFGSFDIYGDPRYELAKLFHSIDGKYDYIIKNLFSLYYDISKAAIDFSIQDNIQDFDLYQLFLNVFRDEIGQDLKKIELIEALLFLSMIPLHGESLNHQMVMLGTGLSILKRVVSLESV